MHFVPEERLPHHGPFPTSWRPTDVSRDEKIYTLRYHGCWSLLVTIDFWWWTLLYNLRRAVAVDCSSFRRRALPRPRRDQTPLREPGCRPGTGAASFAQFVSMPRPRVSPENSRFALEFARMVVTSDAAAEQSFVARHGDCSIFSLLRKCHPGIIREQSMASKSKGGWNRKGISEAELLRLLAQSGFSRCRDRKAKTMEKDPTGAGMCMFKNLRWRNPESPEDAWHLRERHRRLSKSSPSTCSFKALCASLTATITVWELHSAQLRMGPARCSSSASASTVSASASSSSSPMDTGVESSRSPSPARDAVSTSRGMALSPSRCKRARQDDAEIVEYLARCEVYRKRQAAGVALSSRPTVSNGSGLSQVVTNEPAGREAVQSPATAPKTQEPVPAIKIEGPAPAIEIEDRVTCHAAAIKTEHQVTAIKSEEDGEGEEVSFEVEDTCRAGAHGDLWEMSPIDRNATEAFVNPLWDDGLHA